MGAAYLHNDEFQKSLVTRAHTMSAVPITSLHTIPEVSDVHVRSISFTLIDPGVSCLLKESDGSHKPIPLTLCAPQ